MKSKALGMLLGMLLVIELAWGVSLEIPAKSPQSLLAM